MAISSTLIETSIKGAGGVIISIAASTDVGLEDVDLASTMIANECNPDASVIWGVAFDPELEDEMRITIIATGFEKKEEDEKTVASPVVTEPVKRPASAEKDDESPEVPSFEAPAAPAPAPAARPQYAPQAPTYDVPGYNAPAAPAYAPVEGAPARAEGGIMSGETVGDEEFDEMIKMLRNGSRRRDDFRGRR